MPAEIAIWPFAQRSTSPMDNPSVLRIGHFIGFISSVFEVETMGWEDVYEQLSMATSTEPDQSELDSLIADFIDAGMSEQAARISVAALNLFAQKGYAATTVREIVQEAQVTNPMLYYYFESKEGLFVALLEILSEAMDQALGEVLEEHDNFKAQLRGITEVHFQACKDSPQVLRFIYSAMFGPLKSRPSFDVSSAFENIHNMVESAMDAAVARGEFRRRGEMSTPFLVEQYLGMVNNHIMSVLTRWDNAASQAEKTEIYDTYLSDDALESVLDIYFYGATVEEDL